MRLSMSGGKIDVLNKFIHIVDTPFSTEENAQH